jgi:hypothetical protein
VSDKGEGPQTMYTQVNKSKSDKIKEKKKKENGLRQPNTKARKKISTKKRKLDKHPL